jgi:FtsH-binding integral membrane protein
MKILIIIIATFIIAFATSALFELKCVDTNPVRYALVVFLIIIELLTGFFYIKSEIKN